MQLFEVHRMRLACIVQAISSSTRKDLARSKGFAEEGSVQFVHPLMGKMGGLPKARQLRRPVGFMALRVLKQGRII
jgi:hypothetical protein